MTRELFEERIMELMEPLYYVSCAILSGKADREDALQNCLEKGLRRCGTLRDASKLKPWITRILVNECYTILRGKRRIVLAEEVPFPPAGGVDIALRELVLALPENRRLPLIMQLEGYGVRDISRVLHMPEGTVKLRLREAKAALRAELEAGEEESI